MFEPVAPGVGRLGILFVNALALGEPGGPWLLVDAGLPGSAGVIRRAVARRFAAGAQPEAILLTHGHFDHVGAARDLGRSRNSHVRRSKKFAPNWSRWHHAYGGKG